MKECVCMIQSEYKQQGNCSTDLIHLGYLGMTECCRFQVSTHAQRRRDDSQDDWLGNAAGWQQSQDAGNSTVPSMA